VTLSIQEIPMTNDSNIETLSLHDLSNVTGGAGSIDWRSVRQAAALGGTAGAGVGAYLGGTGGAIFGSGLGAVPGALIGGAIGAVGGAATAATGSITSQLWVTPAIDADIRARR
jgi:hypothetical protein